MLYAYFITHLYTRGTEFNLLIRIESALCLTLGHSHLNDLNVGFCGYIGVTAVLQVELYSTPQGKIRPVDTARVVHSMCNFKLIHEQI